MSALTYPEVGATRRTPLPAGYRHLHHRTRIGHGGEVFARAADAVTTWRMHRETGARMDVTDPRADPGTRLTVSLGIGPLRIDAPCQVVWAAYGQETAGFAYGTLDRHPERGEECFLVELAADGTVWFSVTAFSRPGCWYTAVAGPLIPVLQRAYARRLGRTLRRIAAA
ncbi:DUF1990 family protein [Streptomyces sp. NBC_00344]|uniref:DUF1990 family protein n=1 Tax=Streptomyces sp. NBC_00344 TaxID=2975720 RepID=UPI002E1E0E70